MIIQNQKLYKITKTSSDGKVCVGDTLYRNIYTKEIIVENIEKYRKYNEADILHDFEADDISDNYDFITLGYCKVCEWVTKGSIEITEEDPNKD